jgi:hypothetical protein
MGLKIEKTGRIFSLEIQNFPASRPNRHSKNIFQKKRQKAFDKVYLKKIDISYMPKG